jgi:type VI secretion system protein VasG
VGFAWDEEVAQAIAARCTEVDSGARNVDHILSNAVLPELSRLVLEHLSMSTGFGDVHMVLDAQENFAFHFRPAGPLERR